jgi:hypothetical protein
MRLHSTISATTLALGLVAAGRVAAQRVTAGRDVVLFENATIDVVRVYLLDGGGEWLLGRAEAGQMSVLPLPPGFSRQSGGQISLVAVALGARVGQGGRGALGAPVEASRAAMRSEAEPAENLWRMRWKLAGHQLFSVPRTP